MLSVLTSIIAVRCATTWPEWKLPEGYDTGIKVYNFVAKKKVRVGHF